VKVPAQDCLIDAGGMSKVNFLIATAALGWWMILDLDQADSYRCG